MGALILDASVVLALLNPADTLGPAVVRALAAARERADEFVLPASAMAESLVWTARDRPDQLDILVRRLTGLFGQARPVDQQVAVATARLRARHRALRLPDALVIATAVVADGTVLTCDGRLASVDPRVQVLSP